MGSKRFVPVILFVGLLLGGSYYYLCTIKQVCDGVFQNIGADLKGVTDSLQDGLSPLSFRYNSAEPVVGSDFNTYRESLLNKLGENDTLIINANYYRNETNGSDLARERAGNVRSLLIDHCDANRLLTYTDYDAITDADDQSSLEAVKFTVASGNNWVDDNATDTAESAEWVTEETQELPVENQTTNQSISTNSTVQVGDQMLIYFSKGSIKKRITSDVRNYIDQAILMLSENPDLKIYVEGHSNSEGEAEENYQLGRRRAWVVKKMIWDKGVDPMRIITSSKGDLEPMNTLDDEVGKAYNRRVVLTIK